MKRESRETERGEGAASLAAGITSSTGDDAQPLPGGKGQFDVVRDGELIFSKQQAGRFPEENEILRLLA